MWKIKQQVNSKNEPELGTGIIVNVTAMHIEVHFPNSGIHRLYTAESKSLTVNLADEAQTPLGQFQKGNLSPFEAYSLHHEALRLFSKRQSSPVQGLVGPRLKPLPHQLYIAKEIVQRMRPRAILADEVGLGKTIEAGMIFSALKAQNRVRRVLIITPKSLENQWMAEMYRRFSELFTIIDQERLEAEANNPFECSQQIICASNFLLQEGNEDIFTAALSVPWDLIIVDEAHHLSFDPEGADYEWIQAKILLASANYVLLCTATPRLFGLENQFGLLHLLDSSRFDDFAKFCKLNDNIKELADLATQIKDNSINENTIKRLKSVLPLENIGTEHLKTQDKRLELIHKLIDRHGTGRVIFRNRRAKLQGFPRRTLIDVPIKISDNFYVPHLKEVSDSELSRLACGRLEFKSIITDEKFQWLLNFLRNDKEKALILCFSAKEAELLYQTLGLALGKAAALALFHEKMDLLERDKQAALFTQDNGARILISSEIGGEGRNFQCTQRLILWDLPKLPSILEQRIGRLDRIGQGKEIKIYVPYRESSPEEVLFRWYHEGFNAFNQCCPFANNLLEEYASDLLSLFALYLHKDKKRGEFLNKLLQETKASFQYIYKEQEENSDILIDLSSFSEEKGLQLQEEVFDCDDDPSIEFFIKNVLNFYGVDYDELDENGSISINSESLSFIDYFPGLATDSELSLAFSREVALKREEMLFVTQDHWLLDSVLSLLLDRGEGQASLAYWPNNNLMRGFILECSVIIDAIGASEYSLANFFADTCKEFIFHVDGEKLTEMQSKNLSYRKNEELLRDLKEESHILEKISPFVSDAVEKAKIEIESWAKKQKNSASIRAKKELDFDIQRLKYLISINPQISSEELFLLEQHAQRIETQIKEFKARIAGLRIIILA